MERDYSLEEITQISDVYLLETKTEKRYQLENYMPKGAFSIHLYTYEDMASIPGLNLCLVVIAKDRKFVSNEIKLENITGTFCTYKVRDVRFAEENKRQFKRVGYLKPVDYYVANKVFQAEGVNLSAGGLCMRTLHLPNFRICEVELSVDNKIIRVQAQPVRFYKEEKDHMYTLHMKFSNIDRMMEQKLCNYVFRLELAKCRQERTRKTV